MIEEPYLTEDDERHVTTAELEPVYGTWIPEEQLLKRLKRDKSLDRARVQGAVKLVGMRSRRPYWLRVWIVERGNGFADYYRLQGNGNIEKCWVSIPAADPRLLRDTENLR
jgi:hypothetical protein